jgi:hypothetical protein
MRTLKLAILLLACAVRAVSYEPLDHSIFELSPSVKALLKE